MNSQKTGSGDSVNSAEELPKEDTATSASKTFASVLGDTTPVVENWQPVRSKKNKQQGRAKSLDTKGVPSPSQMKLSSTKDELPFLMDEELTDQQLVGRKKAYTDHDLDSDVDDYEISDNDLAKIIIVMQTPRKGVEPVYDRTGDFTTRVKVTQEMSQIINDGLFYYEQDLCARFGDSETKQHKTLGLISQEDFEVYSGSPKKSACATPPPPPPPTYVDEDEDIEFDETYLSGSSLFFLFVYMHHYSVSTQLTHSFNRFAACICNSS